jgi:hypothetical protein
MKSVVFTTLTSISVGHEMLTLQDKERPGLRHSRGLGIWILRALTTGDFLQSKNWSISTKSRGFHLLIRALSKTSNLMIIGQAPNMIVKQDMHGVTLLLGGILIGAGEDITITFGPYVMDSANSTPI